jgi:hypothetical protein
VLCYQTKSDNTVGLYLDMQSLCLLAALAPQLVCAADPSLACTPKQCDLYSVIYNETVSKLCSITPQTAHHAPQFELCRMHAAYHLTQRSVQLGVRRVAANRTRWHNFKERLARCTAYTETAICSRAHGHEWFAQGTSWTGTRDLQTALLSTTVMCESVCPDYVAERNRAGACLLPIYGCIHHIETRDSMLIDTPDTMCARGTPDQHATVGTSVSCREVVASDDEGLHALGVPAHFDWEAAVLGYCKRELFARSSPWNIRLQAVRGLQKTQFGGLIVGNMLMCAMAIAICCCRRRCRRHYIELMGALAALGQMLQGAKPVVPYTFRCILERILLATLVKFLAPCLICATFVLVVMACAA